MSWVINIYLWKTDDMTDEISEISVNWLVSSAWYWKFWKISEVAKISGLFGKCSSNCRLNWKSSSTTNLLLFAVLTIFFCQTDPGKFGYKILLRSNYGHYKPGTTVPFRRIWTHEFRIYGSDKISKWHTFPKNHLIEIEHRVAFFHKIGSIKTC